MRRLCLHVAAWVFVGLINAAEEELSGAAMALAVDDECAVAGPEGQAGCAMEALQTRRAMDMGASAAGQDRDTGGSQGGAWAGRAACPRANARAWCDPARPLDERVELLVSAIKAEDLAPQLTNDLFGGVPAIESLGIMKYNYVKENDHGLLLRDVKPGPTSFPAVITIASSFNTSLVTTIGKATGVQARFFSEVGYKQDWDGRTGYLEGLLLQNNINIFRDPRWGRGQETAGEDPYLTSQYVAAWIAGVQTAKGPGGVPLAGLSCKHFAAYSFEGGPTDLNKSTGIRAFVKGHSNLSRHNFNAVVDERDMADTYRPAFESCIRSGAKGTMCAYNQLNGVPTCGNKEYETDWLRETWGFEGMVVTDCDSIADMYYPQKWRSTPSEAIRSALEAGTDVACSPSFFKDHATPAMEPLLRRAVARAFRVRFQLGEFDPPSSPAADPDARKWIEPGLRLAREAAQQSAVLLKNEGGALPLDTSARVAVLGPLRNATEELLGSYSPDVMRPITSPLAALRPASPGNVHAPPGGPELCSSEYSPIGKPDADVAIIVAGTLGEDRTNTDPDMRPIDSAACRGNCLEAEGCDRQSIAWPLAQQQLLDEASTWGMPVILVIISGGPLDLSRYAAPGSGIRAILWMGFPGEMGGVALADLVYGAVSPSGRLPQTFYSAEFAAVADIRDMRMRPEEAAGSGAQAPYPGRTYRFVDERFVVYPFGHGLSYQTWSYSERGCSCLGFSCELTLVVACPAGPWRDAATSVLLFARPPALPGAGRPRRELRRFAKVRGAPAGHRVGFSLGRRDFELAGLEGSFGLVAGAWTFEAGDPGGPGASFVISVGENGCQCQ